MTNLFDDPQGEFYVLVNDERQHCIWPAPVEVPAGWSVAYGTDTRADCLSYVEQNWTDIRPASLVAAMGEQPDHENDV